MNHNICHFKDIKKCCVDPLALTLGKVSSQIGITILIKAVLQLVQYPCSDCGHYLLLQQKV